MRNSRMMMLVIGLTSVTLTLGGCKNSVKDENAMLTQENGTLKSQLADRTKALEDCNSDLRSREQQLSQMRRDGTDGGKGGASTANPAGGKTGFEGIEGVTGSVGAGEVTASVESDLLFDSGKTSLKSSAKKSLDAVAGVLKSTYAGRNVRIAGHTDADPIKRSGFKSNYHLAFERAYAVREYLASKGVDAKHMYLASFGPDMPKGTKPQSRRVEIIVVTN